MTVHIIGRYKIIRELRRGGMATVYRAYDPHFEREVAVKVLPRELLFDSQFRARFETEAKTLASLEHSAIVPVYDFGEQEGQPYLVMRYMPAGSLEDRLKQGTIPLVEAARILLRLAPALDEAHARGLVHRDLKPANILFDQRNEPFITDFGVVKISGTRLTDTSNSSIGTPAYMSPEQARGEADIDGRSDIFALGAVLFEMLTGKIPYDADTAAGQLVRRLTDPVPDILQLRPDLPGGVQEIIARSLAKRRYVRFPTASDMAQALDAVAQGRTPRETLVLDKNRTLSGGRPVRAGKDGSLKPRLVKKPTLQRNQTRSLLLRGAGLLAAVLLLTALFYFGWQAANAGFGNGETGMGGLAAGQTATMKASGSPAAALSPAGSVAEVNGSARVQVPGQETLALSEGMLLADVPGLRVWSESGSLKLVLESGAEVWLAEGTEISLPEESRRTAFAQLQLARGSLLVIAEQILVTTEEPELRVAVASGAAGIEYEPVIGRFLVDCLAGLCRVGQDSPQDLAAGQRGGSDRGQPLPTGPAEYDFWVALGGTGVPTATFTPTLTPTVTPTATATQTPEPSATPELTATDQPPAVFPTSPPSLPQPTNAPQPTARPTDPPRPTNTSAPPPTNPPQPTPTIYDPNQG